MCGIVGFRDQSGSSRDVLERRIHAMAECLRHRGPDDSGTWVDAQQGVGLGFRRLAIIDLSDAARQPMSSADDRYVIVFNGEIYNFRELRIELEALGARFRGTSDTEVLVEACAHWGVERAIPRCWGMFSCAIWDRLERRLLLARDRIGKKPLYYGDVSGRFVFASELKSLLQLDDARFEVNRDVLAMYLRRGYVPAPWSLLRGICKLPAGHLAELPMSGPVRVWPYWTLQDAVAAGQRDPWFGSVRDAEDEFDRLLLDSVQRRMVADVPLGVFLSGGLDSSLIAGMMQATAAQAVRSFSIGFHEAGYDEAEDARAVAKHLRTDHMELYVSARDARDVIPALPVIYDEPFADSSQIPTVLLARFTRQQVTVALSGDGGDELFYGYTRYQRADATRQRLHRVPSGIRRAMSFALRQPSPERWDVLGERVGRVLGRTVPAGLGERLHGLSDALGPAGERGLYRYLTSQWKRPASVVIGGTEPADEQLPPVLAAADITLGERMMYLDTMEYLPDDILVKVDRASMAASLEVRCPLLDHRLVEWVWRLPPALRSGTPPKHLLRNVLHRYVPPMLVDRPKRGFAVPLGEWLRGPLQEWAEELLAPDRLRREGFLQPSPIRRSWAAHLEGTRDHQYELWTVLMFQSWLERWRLS